MRTRADAESQIRLFVQRGEGQPELERILERNRNATNAGRAASRLERIELGPARRHSRSRRSTGHCRTAAAGKKTGGGDGHCAFAGIQLRCGQRCLHRGDGICGIVRKEVVAAGCAIRGRSGARALLRGAGDRAVDAEGLPEPEDSEQHHEHQGQDGGGFRDLGAAGFGAQPSTALMRKEFCILGHHSRLFGESHKAPP